MSYLSDASNEYLEANFGSQKSQPLTAMIWMKVSDYLADNRHWLSFGESNSSINSELLIWSHVTADEAAASHISSSGGNKDADYTFSAGKYDNRWVPLVGVWASATERQIYVGTVSEKDPAPNTDSVTGVDPQYVRVGCGMTGSAVADGSYAQVAVWDTALSELEISALLNGADPNYIDSANLLGYWSLDTDQSTHSDEGPNSGPSMSLNSATYSSDQPLVSEVYRLGEPTTEHTQPDQAESVSHDVAHTVETGTELLIASITIHAPDDFTLGNVRWDAPGVSELFTLIDSTTSSSTAGDIQTLTYALLNPTAKSANVNFDVVSGELSRWAITITNWTNVDTSSLANAIVFKEEVVANSPGTTMTFSSTGSAGNVLYACCGWHGLSNTISFSSTEFGMRISDVVAGTPISTDVEHHCVVVQNGPSNLVSTSSTSNEHAGHIFEIVAASNATAGETINRVLTENTVVTDPIPGYQLTQERPANSNINVLTDAAFLYYAFARLVVENVPFEDQYIIEQNLRRDLSDAATITDAVEILHKYFRAVSEGISLSDGFTKNITIGEVGTTYSRVRFDALSVYDSYDAVFLGIYDKQFADTISLGEAEFLSRFSHRSVPEQIAIMADLLNMTRSKVTFDSFRARDSITKTLTRVTNITALDSFALTDSFERDLQYVKRKTLTDTFALLDSDWFETGSTLQPSVRIETGIEER